MFGDIRHTPALTEYPAGRMPSGSTRCPVSNRGLFCAALLEMFIRWKRRKKAASSPLRRPRRGSEAGDSLYCVLVESQRINGVPRQKVICYLASLNEGDREKMWLRIDFWDRVRPVLIKLNLLPRERAKIEQSISLLVAPASAEEVAGFEKEAEAWLRGLEQLVALRDLVFKLKDNVLGKQLGYHFCQVYFCGATLGTTNVANSLGICPLPFALRSNLFFVILTLLRYTHQLRGH